MRYTKEDVDNAFEEIEQKVDIEQDMLEFLRNAGKQLVSLREKYHEHMDERERMHEFLMHESHLRWACETKLYKYYDRISKDTYGIKKAYEIETKRQNINQD